MRVKTAVSGLFQYQKRKCRAGQLERAKSVIDLKPAWEYFHIRQKYAKTTSATFRGSILQDE